MVEVNGVGDGCLKMGQNEKKFLRALKLTLDYKDTEQQTSEDISNLAQSFDSGAENLLVGQLGRYIFYPRNE